MKEENTPASVSDLDPVRRSSIRHDGPEVRAKITEHLYRALNREAGALGISVAELVRRILQEHYRRISGDFSEIRGLLTDLSIEHTRASSERALLIAMLDLVYKGLLLRLPRPEEAEHEQRLHDARDGHASWRAELARQLADGLPEDLLVLAADYTTDDEAEKRTL